MGGHPIRHPSRLRASGGRPPESVRAKECLPKLLWERRETVPIWQAMKWTGARRCFGGGVSPVALPRAKEDCSRHVVRLNFSNCAKGTSTSARPTTVDEEFPRTNRVKSRHPRRTCPSRSSPTLQRKPRKVPASSKNFKSGFGKALANKHLWGTSKNAQMSPNRGSGRHPASGFWRSVAPERLI